MMISDRLIFFCHICRNYFAFVFSAFCRQLQKTGEMSDDEGDRDENSSVKHHPFAVKENAIVMNIRVSRGYVCTL